MKVSIIGATAYTSRELIRLLAQHPEAQIVHLGGRREGYPHIGDVFTSLRGICDLRVMGMHPEDAPETSDVAFFTLPHAVSRQFVPKYLAAGVRCIDFGADYRLKDLAVFEKWYGPHDDPKNVERAVYGLPELFRDEILNADLVANPGCYPTAVALAIAPLAKAGLIDVTNIIADAKSGVSGRGNKVEEGSMFCECNEDVRAYGVAGHRHQPEMEQTVSRLAGADARITFVPHLIPMDRGILATVYARLKCDATADDLQRAFEEFYAGEPFVRVCPKGKQPRTKDVAFTNYCDVAVALREGGCVVVTSAIDNLMKGAASQAVQNMNVMFGIKETAGLV